MLFRSVEIENSTVLTQSINYEEKSENELNLIRGEQDDKYFNPSTYDYIYIIEYSDEDEINYFQEALLISFDTRGEAVQFIKRIASSNDSDLASYNTENTGEIWGNCYYQNILKEDYLYPYTGWSTKYGVLSDLYSDNSYVDYYISTPLKSDQTKIDNTTSLDKIPSYEVIPMITNDYRFKVDHNKISYEGHIGNYFFGYDDNQEAIEVPVQVYNDFSYIVSEVVFYDTKGYTIGKYQIFTFENSSMIEDYIKQSGYHYIDKESIDPSDKSIRQEEISDEGKAKYYNSDEFTIIENHLIFNDSFIAEYDAFKYCDIQELKNYESSWNTSIYYSVPYLTEEQIKSDPKLK